MTHVYNGNATWGGKGGPSVLTSKPPLLAPTSASNPRGIRAVVGRKAPVPISMRTRPMRMQDKPAVSTSPALQIPTGADLADSTRAISMRISNRRRGKLAPPTQLLSEKQDVSFGPLKPEDEALVNTDLKKAKPVADIDAITSAMLGDAVTAGDANAKQIKGLELLAKTRQLTPAESEVLQQLKLDFARSLSEAVAEKVKDRERGILPQQEDVAEEKAIEDAVIIEAKDYLQDMLRKKSEIDREVTSEAQKLEKQAAGLIDRYREYEGEQSKLEAEARWRIRQKEEMEAQREQLGEYAAAVEEQIAGLGIDEDEEDEARRAELNEQLRDIAAAGEKLIEEIYETNKLIGNAMGKVRDISELITESKLSLAENAKNQKKLAKTYASASRAVAKAMPKEAFVAASKKLAGRRTEGDLELYLRKIVGPTAAYKLSRKLVRDEPELEEPMAMESAAEFREPTEEKTEEIEAIEGIWAGPARPVAADIEEFAPRQIDTKAHTEEIKDLDDAQLEALLYNLEQRKKELESDPPRYDISEEKRRRELIKVGEVADLVDKERAVINEFATFNKQVSKQWLSTEENAREWLRIQTSPKTKLSEQEKQWYIPEKDLLRMFKAYKRDFGERGDFEQPKFDINKNAGRKLQAGEKNVLPNANRSNVAEYLASVLYGRYG